ELLGAIDHAERPRANPLEQLVAPGDDAAGVRIRQRRAAHAAEPRVADALLSARRAPDRHHAARRADRPHAGTIHCAYNPVMPGDDFRYRDLRTVGKRVFRLGLAANYGIEEAGIRAA